MGEPKEERVIGINTNKMRPSTSNAPHLRQRESRTEKEKNATSLFLAFYYNKSEKSIQIIFKDEELYRQFRKKKKTLLKKLCKKNIPELIPIAMREDQSWFIIKHDQEKEYVDSDFPNTIKRTNEGIFIRWIEIAEEKITERFLLTIPGIKNLNQMLKLIL